MTNRPARDYRVAPETQEMVLELLKTEADMDGIVIVSYAYVGEKIGVSKDTVSAAVQMLLDQGALKHGGYQTIHRLATLYLTDY